MLQDDLSRKIKGLTDKKVFVVIWTTTPWTIPANLAIALHPEFTYVAYELPSGETYIVAEKMLDAFLKSTGVPEGKGEMLSYRP